MTFSLWRVALAWVQAAWGGAGVSIPGAVQKTLDVVLGSRLWLEQGRWAR